MSYSLTRPALVLDTWSPLAEGTVAIPAHLELNEIRLIASLQGALDAPQGEEVARLEWLKRGEIVQIQPLRAGDDLAEMTGFGSERRGEPAHGEGSIAVVTGKQRANIYTFVVAKPSPYTAPDKLRLRVLRPGAKLAVHGISAVDVYGRHKSLWSPPLRRVEGTPRVIALDFDPGRRAALYSRVQFARDARHAFELMTRGDTEYPLRPVVEPGPWGRSLHSNLLAPFPADQQTASDAEMEFESATELRIRTNSQSPGMLVVRDAFDLGWKGYVDGQQVPVLRADLVSRAVPVPGGAHLVVLRYDPATLSLGMAISLVTLGATAAGLAFWQWPRIARLLRRRGR